ncbi:hypothetical protein [Alsobacter sp. R-9]
MTTRLTIAAAALLASLAAAPAVAADRSFIIPANDGYGIADCLGEGGPCARVVADAWCAAQGLGKAVTFGPADASEMTASLRGGARASVQAYTVTCNE